ncbi:nucleoside kinase [uncultured Duncaniella sp.]|uniref:nucleoside kinase n=1 Tax=uncultured Duncaniella sp. TaxID=2768039 RepID=UPI0025ED62A7|nr:nucleoside kinase [uncultured Duncaniella sp.]
MKLYCVNLQEYVPFTGGETLQSVVDRLGGRLGFTPLCALVNNKEEGLSFPLYAPKQVEFVSVGEPAGQRCYIRSLCMVLYRALARVAPGARLEICNAVSGGYYVRITRTDLDRETAARDISEEMRRLIAADLPIERKEKPTSEVIEMFREQGLDAKVSLLESLHELYTIFYRLDGLADTTLSPLVPRTGLIGEFGFVPYEEGFLLLGCSHSDVACRAEEKPQPKLFRAFQAYQEFNRIIGISNAGSLNAAVDSGESGMMINVAEALHSKHIRGIAQAITDRHRSGGAKVVLIAGPSSSGKTTFTKRLAIELLTNLLHPVMISLDDYFVDRHLTPVDETGDYDYESLMALDLELFNKHLCALIRGEEVELPTYNFEKGTREFRGKRISLPDDGVLLIEGIHGLNPELTRAVADDMKYRVYVSALSTISIDDHNWVSTTDNRLLRRIIRDYKYRGTSALSTIRRWPSVRRGEEKWIFPYQENADSMFNSSFIFELGVMRDEAEKVLRTVPRDVPEYAQAHRLRRFLGYFASVSSRLIPPTSLMREFLGGSSFKY